MLPAQLLYPSLGLADIETEVVVLTDRERLGQDDRGIPVAIRHSPSAPRPMPVVVLSHGGAFGHVDPLGSMREWATILAQHGYLTVAIAHGTRTDIERIVLTMHLGGTLPQCREFKTLNFDRPLDFLQVVGEIVDRSHTPPWSGVIDTERVAYMGHSAGAGAAMMVAGAGREYMPGLGLAFATHGGPRAFVAMSPQGVGEDGFQPTSWEGVSRPVLMCTGASDGDHPHERRDPFDYMAPGNKYLLWIEHPGAAHMLFAGETDSCVREIGDPTLCSDMLAWLDSSVRAFLDAHVRGDVDARDYLASDQIVQASSGVVEWESK